MGHSFHLQFPRSTCTWSTVIQQWLSQVSPIFPHYINETGRLVLYHGSTPCAELRSRSNHIREITVGDQPNQHKFAHFGWTIMTIYIPYYTIIYLLCYNWTQTRTWLQDSLSVKQWCVIDGEVSDAGGIWWLQPALLGEAGKLFANEVIMINYMLYIYIVKTWQVQTFPDNLCLPESSAHARSELHRFFHSQHHSCIRSARCVKAIKDHVIFFPNRIRDVFMNYDAHVAVAWRSLTWIACLPFRTPEARNMMRIDEKHLERSRNTLKIILYT